MILTEIEIKDIVYKMIYGSILHKSVNGVLKKTKRSVNSTTEDIIISVLDSDTRQLQQAFVNVNIYCADDIVNGQAEECTIRLRELCRIADDFLSVQHINGIRITLDKQKVFEVDGKDEHMINNRLLLTFAHE